jgi:purine-binding chemotaxis protein CheW
MSIKDYVTLRIDGQLFGIEALRVQDVFYPRGLTAVPMARLEIDGVLNLRGRIVTAVCARKRLGLGPRPKEAEEPLAIGIEINGDFYGLVIDSVDEVLKLNSQKFHQPPGNLPPRWTDIIIGVYQLDKELLIIVEPNALLDASHLIAA